MDLHNRFRIKIREWTRRVKDRKRDPLELVQHSGQDSLVVWTARVLVGVKTLEGKELACMKRQPTMKSFSEMVKYKKAECKLLVKSL